MTKFINENIEINELPNFDELQLNRLQSKYFNVIAINLSLFNFLVLILVFVISYFKSELFSNRVWMIMGAFIGVMIFLSYLLAKLSFNKKGYAFRTHDAIYKSGLISETTTIIPFNRVQHVALHQGFISRKLGLASIELFTAGGSSSDIEIPGLLLEEAQKIKNLVSQKINPILDTIETDPTTSVIKDFNE
ncbi:PH domain-containing protein [Flavobacterium sp.]|jgi:membrane protein YdbS with pleckstrin-like domain|uniref:PH domain-containing protein n=1 Tax=Flavobacterium sp. TaxID=239 RepID=UPI0037C173B6